MKMSSIRRRKTAAVLSGGALSVMLFAASHVYGATGHAECPGEPAMFTVFPAEYEGALRNPLKGFRPDLRRAASHEYASIARHYIKWSELEKNERDSVEKIRDFCDRHWAGLDEQGIKVIPRIYLDWNKNRGNEYWPDDLETGDYTSFPFRRRLERLIMRLGACWDQDPRVAWVQMGIIGYWGEHHNPSPSPRIEKLMGETFEKAFPNKKVLVRHADEFTDYNFGIYWDSWAHVDQVKTHGAKIEMLNKATDRWMTAPIEGEVAYDWGRHRIQPGESPDDTLADPVHRDALLDMIRKLHCSGLGWVANYDASNAAVRDGARDVQKAFGYRFVIPEFSCTGTARPDGGLRLAFSVVNTGSAPFYERWPLEFSLLDPVTRRPVWKTTLDKVDIREWLPGDDWDAEDNVYRKPAKVRTVNARLRLPGQAQLPAGEYIAALAILDPVGREPALRFAVDNYFTGGRHPLGRVGIGKPVVGSHALDPASFDDPMQADARLAYAVEDGEPRQVMSSTF